MSRKLCLMTAVHGEPTPANVGGGGWTVNDGEFGARLALVRQRMKWNIKEAATECGLPAASWASWEAGSMPRRYAEVCEKIAQRTGADFLWLMAGPGRVPRPQAIREYSQVADRLDQLSRPRDNRPSGHPAPAAAAGPTRTAYLPRRRRRGRD